MTGSARVGPRLDFEAFGAAVGSALVCGALSVVVPLFVAPTATLAALALAGWVSLSRRRGSLTLDGLGTAPLAALCVLGGTGVGFLISPSFLGPFRALLLAAGLVPLFVVERSRSLLLGPVFTRS